MIYHAPEPTWARVTEVRTSSSTRGTQGLRVPYPGPPLRVIPFGLPLAAPIMRSSRPNRTHTNCPSAHTETESYHFGSEILLDAVRVRGVAEEEATAPDRIARRRPFLNDLTRYDALCACRHANVLEDDLGDRLHRVLLAHLGLGFCGNQEGGTKGEVIERRTVAEQGLGRGFTVDDDLGRSPKALRGAQRKLAPRTYQKLFSLLRVLAREVGTS